MLIQTRFTLPWLLVIVFIYAVASTLSFAFALPLVQAVVAFGIITVFVGFELGFIEAPLRAHPRSMRLAILIAYFSTSIAVATVGCIVVFVVFTMPLASSPEERSVLTGAFDPLVRTFATILTYAGVYSLFSFVAFSASLLSLRSRIARWLLLINFPGTALFGLFAIGLCSGGWHLGE